MALPVASTDRLTVAGNSITAETLGRRWWWNVVKRLDATWDRAPGYYLVVPKGRCLVVNNTAIGGQVIQDLITNFTAQFTATNPTLLLVEIGVNDVGAALPRATWQANLATLAGLIVGIMPAAKVGFLSIMTRGEVWTSGSPNTWGPNAGAPDATIDLFNADLAAQCAASGFTYFDVRAAMLVQEAILNPTKQASGFLTVFTDGVHLLEAGKDVACVTVQAGMAVAP